MKDTCYVALTVSSLLETLAYLALKRQFKALVVEMLSTTTADLLAPLAQALKFLIMLAVQKSSSLHTSALTSTLVFFALNMMRSEEYDIQVPSHTLKFADELKDKEISYFEIKQLQKTMRHSPKLLAQLGQKYVNEYGPELAVQTLREQMVTQLDLLSALNGSFAMSKQGP